MQGAAQSAVDSLRDETEKLRAEALSQRSDISKTKAEVGAVLQGALCRHASCWLILIKLSDAHYQQVFYCGVPCNDHAMDPCQNAWAPGWMLTSKLQMPGREVQFCFWQNAK